MFSYTEALPLLMQLIVNWPQRVLAQELGALAVNVSHNSRNAENMCQVGFLKKFNFLFLFLDYTTKNISIQSILHIY